MKEVQTGSTAAALWNTTEIKVNEDRKEKVQGRGNDLRTNENQGVGALQFRSEFFSSKIGKIHLDFSWFSEDAVGFCVCVWLRCVSVCLYCVGASVSAVCLYEGCEPNSLSIAALMSPPVAMRACRLASRLMKPMALSWSS